MLSQGGTRPLSMHPRVVPGHALGEPRHALGGEPFARERGFGGAQARTGKRKIGVHRIVDPRNSIACERREQAPLAHTKERPQHSQKFCKTCGGSLPESTT